MECSGKAVNFSKNFKNGNPQITLEINESYISEQQFDEIMKADKLKIKITKFRNSRSIDANNYMWEILSQLAPLVKTTKDELYIEKLQKYGSFMYVPGTEEDEEKLKKVFRIVINRGDTTLTTPTGKVLHLHQYQCYKGSSLYDTLEMSRLLDGIVEDAREEGVDTATPTEIERMKKLWQTSGKASL